MDSKNSDENQPLIKKEMKKSSVIRTSLELL
jgi:hypothetical protein